MVRLPGVQCDFLEHCRSGWLRGLGVQRFHSLHPNRAETGNGNPVMPRIRPGGDSCHARFRAARPEGLNAHDIRAPSVIGTRRLHGRACRGAKRRHRNEFDARPSRVSHTGPDANMATVKLSLADPYSCSNSPQIARRSSLPRLGGAQGCLERHSHPGPAHHGQARHSYPPSHACPFNESD
jgi:hypothetical protein